MTKLSWSKWSKHRVMQKSAKVGPHLPATRIMNNANLRLMLNKHREIILKPTTSSGGNGVMKVSILPHKRYLVHVNRSIHKFSDASSLERFLARRIARAYMIQKRIRLAAVDGRPFDLRVMVQRRKGGDWTVTGKLAKVAGKGYIITNTARSRGRVIPARAAINQSSIHRDAKAQLSSRIDELALNTARKLREAYPYNRIMGIDMGIDHTGKLWIIEVNFSPALSLFRRLKDKSMFRKILAYR